MDREKNRGIASKIPPVEEVERRFLFVADEVVRRNCAMTLQHVVFLIAVLEAENAEGTTIASATYKDLIVQTASIVETCLLYGIRAWIEGGKVSKDDIASVEWDYVKVKVLHEISAEEEVCGAVRRKKKDGLGKEAKFAAVNRSCKKAGILSDENFARAEKIRKLRNRIHLLGLTEVDDKYMKSDADRVFEDARLILDAVEKALT